MLLRMAYRGLTNTFALLRLLLPSSDRDKDAETLALRHQLAVPQRQLDRQRVRFDPADRAWLAALLHRLPKPALHSLRLLVRPDTILRWHRDLQARHHAAASRPRRRGRPRTIRSIRALVLRLAQENPSWGYRRVHGELLTPGIKVAASTVWEILRTAGINPAPDRVATTWAQFLRSPADALVAADFIETLFDAVLANAGTTVVRSGVRVPRMNAVMNAGCAPAGATARPDADLQPAHLPHALREYENFYHGHRPHQGIANARPLAPLPEPITDPDQIAS